MINYNISSEKLSFFALYTNKKKTKKEAFMNVLFKVYSGMKKVYYAMDAS